MRALLTRALSVIPPRLRKLLVKLAVLGASSIGALIIAEFVFRAVGGDAVFMMPRYVTGVRYNEYEIRRNVPSVEYVHTSADGQWRYVINSQGFRDLREFSYEKPPGRLRILTLGDSYTLGFEVGQNETYAAVLERFLTRQGLDVEVINAGVSGFSTAEELVFLREEGLRYQPDVVILGFFVNDLSDNLRADLYRLKDDVLEAASKKYLPAIGIRNFLNSFWIYRWLSENSYLHNYLNATATVFLRDRLASSKQEEVTAGSGEERVRSEDYPDRLARALVREMYDTARAAGAKFILMNIPDPEFTTAFPLGEDGPGPYADSYLDMLPVESEYADLIDLYRPHGFEHWSEFSHLLAGIELGKRVLEWFPH